MIGTGKPTNFELGIRIEYDNPHLATCAVTFKLKALGGGSTDNLQGAGAYCGGPSTDRTACLTERFSSADIDFCERFFIYKTDDVCRFKIMFILCNLQCI